MSEFRQHIAVGATVLLALVGLAFGLKALNGSLSASRTNEFSVLFRDARGARANYEVRLAGVKIGSIKRVALKGRQAQLDVSIDRQFDIPTGSKFVITTPLIGSNPFIAVEPGNGPSMVSGAVVQGSEAAGIDSVLGKVDSLVGDKDMKADLKATLRNVRLASDELPRTLRQVQVVMANANKISGQVAELTPQVQREITTLSRETQSLLRTFEGSATGANKVLAQADGLTGDVRATLNENRAGIKALLRSANDAVAGVTLLTDQLGQTIANKDLQKNIVDATGSLTKVAKTFEATSLKLDATADSLQKLASDPELSGDIKATVHNIRDTSQSVKNLAARIEGLRIPGERRRPQATVEPPPGTIDPSRGGPREFVRTTLIEPGLTFDATYDTTAERLRADAHFVLPSQAGSFYRLGVFDATEGNRFNLQYGRTNANGTGAIRYGLFAGKLGMGFDGRLGPFDLRLDLSDPNRFAANARVKARLTNTMSLTAGLDSIGKDNRATLGVQIRR